MCRLYNDIIHVTNFMFNKELLRQKMVADIMGHPVAGGFFTLSANGVNLCDFLIALQQIKPLLKNDILYKRFAPSRSKLLHYRIEPFLEGDKNTSDRKDLSPLQTYRFLLHTVELFHN